MSKPTNYTLDATLNEEFKFDIKIDRKPFPINGGENYNLTISLTLGNGNRIANLGYVNVINTSGYCSYNIAEQGRANILQGVRYHPNVANFLNAFHAELSRACGEMGFPAPDPYVSINSTSKDGKQYPDTIFTKFNVDNKCDFVKSFVYIAEDEESNPEILLSSEDLEAGTIRTYANNIAKDRGIKALLEKIYGVKITYDPKSKKSTVAGMDKPKISKKLLELTDFFDKIKEYTVTSYLAKFNNIFVKASKTHCLFISSHMSCVKRISEDEAAADEYDNFVNTKTRAKKVPESAEPETVDPEEVDLLG